MSLIARVRRIAGIYFSRTSVPYFCRGFSCCPYYRGVRNSEMSARRELTVCGENDHNLFTNINAFLVSLLLYQLIKTGSIDPSKCKCWKVMETGAGHLNLLVFHLFVVTKKPQ